MVLLKNTRGPALILTLNRPDSLNALSRELLEELRKAWIAFDRDKTLRIAILTGAGQRAFCAGADLKEMAEERKRGGRRAPRPKGIHKGLDVKKPVICAINGVAVGGGLELAMACDLRIAAEHAKLGLTEVKRALIPAGGGTQRLPRLIPVGKAMEMLLTGETITAAEALSLGLLNRVVPGDGLVETAFELADRIAANGPLAVQAVKRAVREGLDLPFKKALNLETQLIDRIRESRDAADGIAAFAEKRKPDYRGK